MTQIKGYQIAPNSVDAKSIFMKDDSGNIIFPDNIKFGNLSINDIQNKVNESLLKKVEKLTKNSDGNFELSENPFGDVQVFVNGLIQAPGDDYSINDKIVNFASVPQDDDKVVAVYNYKLENNPTDTTNSTSSTDTINSTDTANTTNSAI